VVDFKEFTKIEMKIKDGMAEYKGKILADGKGAVKPDREVEDGSGIH